MVNKIITQPANNIESSYLVILKNLPKTIVLWVITNLMEKGVNHKSQVFVFFY